MKINQKLLHIARLVEQPITKYLVETYTSMLEASIADLVKHQPKRRETKSIVNNQAKY